MTLLLLLSETDPVNQLTGNPCCNNNTASSTSSATTYNYQQEIQTILSERKLLLHTLAPRVESFHQISMKRKANQPQASSQTNKRTRWTTQLPTHGITAIEIPPPPPILTSTKNLFGRQLNSSSNSNTSSSSSSSSSSTTTTSTKQPPQSNVLPPDFLQRAEHLSSVFRTKHGETASTKQKREIATVMKDVIVLYSDVIAGRSSVSNSNSHSNNHNTTGHFAKICDVLGLPVWAEESLHILCKNLVTLGLSQDNTLIFAKLGLLPRIIILTRPASRTLVNMTIELSASQPKAVIDGILLPSLLRHDGAAPCSKATVELVSRVAKSLSVAHVSNIIQQLINGNVATGGVRNGVNNGNNGNNGNGGNGGNGGNNGNATAMATLTPSDSSLTLLKTLLSIKNLSLLGTNGSTDTIDQLINWFEHCLISNVETMSKSIKFAGAVHAMIKIHAAKEHVGRIEQIVGKMTGMMTKTCVTALKKLIIFSKTT